MSERMPIKAWDVTVTGYGVARYYAATRGKAMAEAWRCDAFGNITFKDFLKIASCWKAMFVPEGFADHITVNGKPAFFVERNRAYVRAVEVGTDLIGNYHPSEVQPESYRPEQYRTERPSNDRPNQIAASLTEAQRDALASLPPLGHQDIPRRCDIDHLSHLYGLGLLERSEDDLHEYWRINELGAAVRAIIERDSQVTQADIDCRNAIYKELTGLRVDDDIAAQPDWMDKHLSAHRIAAEARGMVEIERLRDALSLFVNCSYPVATEINRRGYNWSEAYLDGALPIARAALNGGQHE